MKRLHITLTLIAALSLAVAACGDGNEALGNGPNLDDPSDAPNDEPIEGPGGSGGDPTIEWMRVEARHDLVDLRPGFVQEVVVDPDDDRVLLVRFFGGVEECYGATVWVVSHVPGDEVVLQLEVGSVPYQGEPPVCIDIALAQEIAVPLDSPVGEADIRVIDPDEADGYVGSSLREAIDAAESEGRVWRLAREDDEEFALTMDYRPDRVNFEVDAGIVTSAWMG